MDIEEKKMESGIAINDKQIKLNEKLYDEFMKKEFDFEHIQSLLDQGADPLGLFDKSDDMATPLDELFGECQCYIYDIPTNMKQLPLLVELLLQNGMNVDSSGFDVLHPLTWLRNDYGTQTLDCLLKAGLSSGYADCFVGDQVGDMMQFEDGFTSEEPFIATVIYALKNTMLCAAYNADNLKECQDITHLIEPQHNNIKILPEFKNWDDFDYDFDFSDNHFYDKIVTITRKGTQERVWSFRLNFKKDQFDSIIPD